MNTTFSLSQAYNDHPIIWLDPSEYNAENKNYASIEDAKRAYNKEKQKIISCYERQIQRLLSQFSIALKQIEYLEDYRKQQNKHNQSVYNSSCALPQPLIEMESYATIDKLNRKIRIMHDEMVNIKNLYVSKIDIICREQLVEIGELQNKNIFLEKRLRATNIQYKILIKKQRDESFLKAKKKIQSKKRKQIVEEEFKLQLEEIQINKDIVINRLAQEYHEIANQDEENKEKLGKLHNKLHHIETKHQNEMSQLKDEYVSRIHYHRKQIQEYLNNNISININHSHSHSQSPSHSSITNYYNNKRLSDTASLDSQSSVESAEIVTSLVIGIDEKLDDLLTPVIRNNHSAHYSQQFNIRFNDDNDNDNDNESDDKSESENDDNDNELTPEPLEQPAFIPIIKYNYDEKRSNASLLFASPLIPLLNNDDTIDKNEYNQLLQQCAEYEDTMKRYEGEIKELQESLNDMLSKNEFQEAEIAKLKEKNTKAKRKEFDWVTKEREFKSLLSQYRELRESNAKLTLTYFTLQCEYDKLKRDFDQKSAMIMNYGDYQINLTNQMNPINQINLQNISSNTSSSSYSNNSNDNSNDSNRDDDDDVVSNEEDDEVDMVVGFMQHVQAIQSPIHNHEYNVSYFANNAAFQYTAKTKDELIEDILKLRDKLSEMTDTKFSILQSTKQEIDRLTHKVKMLEENNNNNNNNNSDYNNDSDDNYNDDNNDNNDNNNSINSNGFEMSNQSRKSFGGNIIGIMNNDKHTYTVSKSNDLDSVAKQVTNKQHQRAQSMANSKYLLPTTNHNHHNHHNHHNIQNNHKHHSNHNNNNNNQHKIIDENHSDIDDGDDC